MNKGLGMQISHNGNRAKSHANVGKNKIIIGHNISSRHSHSNLHDCYSMKVPVLYMVQALAETE